MLCGEPCAATATIPIVGLDNESDPVAAGYAASLARPGGNVTGVFLDQPEVSAKQLQLLRELVPGLARVAVLFDAAIASAQRESVEAAARPLGVTIAPIVWSGPDALPAALQSATQDGARGLIVLVVAQHSYPTESTIGGGCRIEAAPAGDRADGAFRATACPLPTALCK